MYRTLLVDDEPLARRRLRRLLAPYAATFDIVGEAHDGQAAIEQAETLRPELLFLDIQMPGRNGFEVLAALSYRPVVIFTTAHDAYALRAFRVHSLDYLLKPIAPADLAASLEKWQRWRQVPAPALPDVLTLLDTLKNGYAAPTYKTRFLVKVGDQLRSVATGQIDFFTPEDRVTMLYARDGRRYPLDLTLEELVRQLDPHQFFQAHRQYILHVAAIADVRTHFNGRLKVTLRDGHQLMVSRERAAEFKAWLDQ